MDRDRVDGAVHAGRDDLDPVVVVCVAVTELIPLNDVICDPRAKNGTWCCHPYPGHPKGCPNFPKGCTRGFDFEEVRNKYQWFAIVEEFDLVNHAGMMKKKHPGWSDRQCRNPLYWQGGVRKRLREKAEKPDPKLHEWGHMYMPIPGAHGANVFETMAKVGVILERKPETVKKVVLIGIQKAVSA